MFSTREQVAHVVRRMGIGANAPLIGALDSVDAAISHMLEPVEPADPPAIEPPRDWEGVDYEVLWKRLIPWWLGVIGRGEQPLVERMTWFWHDHFAVGGDKVDHSFVLWQHHRLVRGHALGNFRELLHGVARDAAMLSYLDGRENAVGDPNENFAREVMELHTIGREAYTQADVREMARACTGWTVNEPDDQGGFWYGGDTPWAGVFDPERFDGGQKTILGRTGPFGLDEAMDLLLDHPATARTVTTALYRELVGLEPPAATVDHLATTFRRDWSIRTLVEAIVADPAFVSDASIRAKVRTPLEKLASVLQGLPRSTDAADEWMYWMLDKLHYLPLHPPNPAGFPLGRALLDPARLLGSFEILHLCRNLDEDGAPAIDVLEALGLIDVSENTRDLLGRFPRPGLQLGLAFGSPEFLAV